MANVALITYAGLPDLNEDDRLLRDALVRRGHDVAATCWDDPAVDWSGFGGAIVRSTWDYHLRREEFLAWIDSRQRGEVLLWNPPSLLRWNAHKGYLRELERAGIAIPQTRWLDGGARRPLASILEEEGWEQCVVKPSVGASANLVFSTTRRSAGDDQDRLDALLRRGDVLVQEYLPEVAASGEWSLVYFAGEYSHAVLKRPASGDFRVQGHLGGSARPEAPPRSLLEQASLVLEKIPGAWLYARVDGVERAGRFLLMELELLEPHLFLSADPAAPERFAAAIEAALRPGAS